MGRNAWGEGTDEKPSAVSGSDYAQYLEMRSWTPPARRYAQDENGRTVRLYSCQTCRDSGGIAVTYPRPGSDFPYEHWHVCPDCRRDHGRFYWYTSEENVKAGAFFLPKEAYRRVLLEAKRLRESDGGGTETRKKLREMVGAIAGKAMPAVIDFECEKSEEGAGGEGE